MVCYNYYVFDRSGTCLYYHEWSRPKSVKLGAGTIRDDQKMMFGLFFSLKTFAAAMDPKSENKELGKPLQIGGACSFYSFCTNNYKLHFFEAPSGVKMILNTDPNVGDLREQLAYIHGSIYVENVIKSPLHVQGQPFEFEQFTSRLLQYMRSSGIG